MNSQKENSGRFRRKKVYFSMVSNTALRDSALSLRAKGLYALIQSYITLEDFTLYKTYLEKQSKDSHNTFDSAWRELKEHGYLKQFKLRDENNRFIYEYELLDFPEPKNEGMEIEPQPKIPDMEKPYSGKATHGKLGAINNTDQNNTLPNNTNPIISFEDVVGQIGYSPEMIDDMMKNIITIMVEVYNTPDNELLRINQANLSARKVKERFRLVGYEEMEAIILSLNQYNGSIRSMRNFILTTIFNAPSTAHIYFTTKMNQNLYKGDL